MAGMAFCPSYHRSKGNIYTGGTQLFKWDVVISWEREMSLLECGMRP